MQPPANTPVVQNVLQSYFYQGLVVAVVVFGAAVLLKVLNKLRSSPASRRDPYAIGMAAALIWAIPLRMVYFFPSLGGIMGVMSVGFLFVTPLVLGYMAIIYIPREKDLTWTQTIFIPWGPAAASIVIAGLTLIEGVICLVFALPGWVVFASIGGIIGRFVRRTRFASTNAFTFLLMLSPPIVSAFEGLTPGPLSIQTVENEIVIQAPAEAVWQEIRSVRTIGKSELPASFVHFIGFPRPLDAEIDRDGVGAVRKARFEGGVVFTETVTDWEEHRVLGFDIRANTEHIPNTTLDEHVTIGGTYFDTLSGRYEIVQRDEHEVVLKLSSRHRLSTRFNAYASLWSRYVMFSIQENILRVISKRVELRDSQARNF